MKNNMRSDLASNLALSDQVWKQAQDLFVLMNLALKNDIQTETDIKVMKFCTNLVCAELLIRQEQAMVEEAELGE